MEINTDFKIKVSPFNDYRDWFLLEKDKPDEVYKTVLKIFAGELFLGQVKVPINFHEVKCNTVINVTESISLDYIRMTIDEMNIFREKKLDRPVHVKNGDTLNMEYVFTMGDI